MSEGGKARVPIALALSAAIVRLVPLQWLHPLNWDEIEYFQATTWIGLGRLPYRDFWEHHTPLLWFLFAPFTRLTDSPGVAAVLVLRWAQVPVWVATFWLANVFMREAGLSRFARWSAMALALSSSFLMTSAVEFRVDPLSCALYMAGLVLWQRGTPRTMFGAGVMFCLTGFTNIRLGPLLVVTVLLLSVIREHRWRINVRAGWIAAGGVATLVAALLFFAATDSLAPMRQYVVNDNVFGDKYAPTTEAGFVHRFLVTFGVRVIASDRTFEWAAVDAGGIALLLCGFAGLFGVLLRRWRAPDELFVMALLQTIGLIVVSQMHFIYNYHLLLVAVMMLPLVASVLDRITRRGLVLAVLAVAWCVNAFAAIFRGKELDLQYQDFIMREVHARTRPGDRVWSGIPWALRREPAYYYWFLPDMTRQMVTHGYSEGYKLEDIVRNPPAAIVGDYNALRWMARVQRELAPYIVRHYIPVVRNLWMPGLNALVRPGAAAEWIVPRDGTYRLFASEAIGRHRWFRQPFLVASYENNDSASRSRLVLPPPATHPELAWSIDGQPADVGTAVALRKGQRLRVESHAAVPLGVILLPGPDTVLFRVPPGDASLEAATTRVTHVPHIGLRIKP